MVHIEVLEENKSQENSESLLSSRFLTDPLLRIKCYLSSASMSRGRVVPNQSPCPRHPNEPSPHVITIPLSLEKMLNPSPQQALVQVWGSSITLIYPSKLSFEQYSQ